MGNIPLNTNKLTLLTRHVSNDEPCFGLAEVNQVSRRAGAGVRRVQIIQVIRNDRVYEYHRDMGSADTFKTEEFVFPGHIPLDNGHYEVLETVGRLKDAADDFRIKMDKPYRPFDPIDMVKGMEEFATKRRDAKVGRKMFSMVGTS